MVFSFGFLSPGLLFHLVGYLASFYAKLAWIPSNLANLNKELCINPIKVLFFQINLISSYVVGRISCAESSGPRYNSISPIQATHCSDKNRKEVKLMLLTYFTNWELSEVPV